MEGDQLQPSNYVHDGQKRSIEAECFNCEHCQKSFTRKEHLKRHLTSHTSLRQFSCSICSREFRRRRVHVTLADVECYSNQGSRDSLKRHMAIHGHQAAQSFAANSPGIKRTAKACLSCVRSKQRCIGDMPCERCLHKRTRCVYVPTSSPVTIERSNVSSWGCSDAWSTLTPGHAERADETTQDDTSAAPTRGFDTLTSDDRTMNTEFMEVDPLGKLDTISRVTHASATSDNIEVPPLPQMPFSSELDTFSGFLFHPFAPWPEDALATPFGVADYDDIPIATSLDGLQRSYMNSICPTPMPDMQPHAPTPKPNLSGTEPNNAPRFPALRKDDMGTVMSEKFGHIKQVPETAYEKIKQFYQEVKTTPAGIGADDFPPLELLGSFLELYFEYFNPMIPIIHQATFNPSSENWILLLAMMTVGGQYSTLHAREQYITTLQALLQRAISAKVNPPFLRLRETVNSHSWQTGHE